MDRLTREVSNPNDPDAGVVMQTAQHLNDLIAQLIKIRDEFGNIPVVKACYGDEVNESVAMVALEEESVVEEMHVGDHPYIREEMDAWGYEGFVLEVRSDL